MRYSNTPKEVEGMNTSKNSKAVSTLALILIILCSIIFGALISYLWVMGSFYLTPENSTNLAITYVDFPVDHANYFNLSVMNPSNSAYGTNITQIYFTVESNNTIFNVDTSLPSLPIPLPVGTEKTIICNKTWGAYAGENITVHIVTNNASGATYTFPTRLVKLEVEAYFTAVESCNYFNISLTNNADSAINLTISEVFFEYQPVQNMTLTLPRNIGKGETINFRCYASWKGKAKPYIYIKTFEGYVADLRKEVASLANLQITNVTFNEESPVEIGVTVANLPDSTVPYVDITDITITYVNSTKYPIMGMLTSPSFYPSYRLNKGENVTFNHCLWPWVNYRDENFMISVQTKQGFNITKILETPEPLIVRLQRLNFNLNDTNHFALNLWNMPASLQNATVSKIELIHGTKIIQINETTPSLPYNITPVANQTFICTLNWSAYRGENVTIKIYTTQKVNLTIPHLLPIVSLSANFDSNISTQYFKLAVQNRANKSISITGISVNGTWLNTTLTYPKMPATVISGETLQILCPFEWQALSGKDVEIIATETTGFDITITVRVP